jgi:hypothetical protein
MLIVWVLLLRPENKLTHWIKADPSVVKLVGVPSTVNVKVPLAYICTSADVPTTVVSILDWPATVCAKLCPAIGPAVPHSPKRYIFVLLVPYEFPTTVLLFVIAIAVCPVGVLPPPSTRFDPAARSSVTVWPEKIVDLSVIVTTVPEAVVEVANTVAGVPTDTASFEVNPVILLVGLSEPLTPPMLTVIILPVESSEAEVTVRLAEARAMLACRTVIADTPRIIVRASNNLNRYL